MQMLTEENNMKFKVTLSILALAAVGATGAVAAPYGMAGCGLGSIVISSNGFSQVFAATTNGTFYSQTFGITTGTSNCTADGVVLASKEQEAFFEANYANLQRDMAAGGGEYLTALTELLSCDDTVHGDIAEHAQSNYEAVFASQSTTAVQALYSFKIGLSQNSKVASACGAL